AGSVVGDLSVAARCVGHGRGSLARGIRSHRGVALLALFGTLRKVPEEARTADHCGSAHADQENRKNVAVAHEKSAYHATSSRRMASAPSPRYPQVPLLGTLPPSLVVPPARRRRRERSRGVPSHPLVASRRASPESPSANVVLRTTEREGRVFSATSRSE